MKIAVERILFFIFISIFLVSCTAYNKVQVVTNKNEIKINGVKGSTFKMHIPVTIQNNTKHKLYIKKAKFDIFRKGYTFAKAYLNNRVEIPAQSKNEYTVTLNFKVIDVMSVFFTGRNFRNIDNWTDFTANGYIKAGVKILSKKKYFKNIKFEQLINETN